VVSQKEGLKLTARVHGKEEPFTIEVNGRAIPALPGQTVAAVLLAAGFRVWRHTPSGAPRSLFCGMGVCFDCLVTIDGMPDQRACMTPARPGMRVQLTYV
jgi:predicted molibdopterin-dependent oxidoreductase YjgC